MSDYLGPVEELCARLIGVAVSVQNARFQGWAVIVSAQLEGSRIAAVVQSSDGRLFSFELDAEDVFASV